MDVKENLEYTKDHEWVSVEGNIATVGITHWTANTFITGLIQDGNPGAANNKTYTSIELRCLDSTNCTYDIIITGHFVKKN